MRSQRTNSEHKDFIELVRHLDNELAERDGSDHQFYDQFNKLENIKHVVIVYDNDIPLGCGAIKQQNNKTTEIKRMYTSPESRGMGIASSILCELEIWAAELGYSKCILETSIRLPEAIALYKKNGYTSNPNYGQYAEISDSRCFEKLII